MTATRAMWLLAAVGSLLVEKRMLLDVRALHLVESHPGEAGCAKGVVTPLYGDARLDIMA